MSQTKYILSGGLAFAEEKDMEKLRRYSLKGWHVNDFKFMGYTLKKGERQDYIYSVDYRPLTENEAEEYFDFFTSAGWSHIASEADIHLFRAHPGTKPIYSDRDTSIEKYSSLNHSIKKATIPLFLVTVLAWLLVFFSTGMWNTILLTAATILTVFAIPALWTVCAAYSNKWKVKGKNGVAYLFKTIPVLLFLLVVIISVVVYKPNDAVRILTSMVIGGVGLPAAIWIIMSLYQKISGSLSRNGN